MSCFGCYIQTTNNEQNRKLTLIQSFFQIQLISWLSLVVKYGVRESIYQKKYWSFDHGYKVKSFWKFLLNTSEDNIL